MNASPRILVLGHRGMLGHVAVDFFRATHEVVTVEERYCSGDDALFFDAIADAGADVVLNAIGLVKQKSSDFGRLVEINGAFPLRLRLALDSSALLIQPSTDCVFSGQRGHYAAADMPDAIDGYGLSKALGESVGRYPRTAIVRTSIIGPEIGEPFGLLGWLLSQPDGSELGGYTHHRWNGLTTLEWCKVVKQPVEDAQRDPARSPQLIQPCTDQTHTKAEMLRLFAEIFSRDIRVADRPVGPAVDRTLIPTVHCRPLREQLVDLHAWMSKRKGSNEPPRS